MKKERLKFRGWLSNALLLAVLLLFPVGTLSAEGIVSSTQNIVQDNLNRVKNSAQDIVKELESLNDDIQKTGQSFSDGDLKSNIENLKSVIEDLKSIDAEQLKGMDLTKVTDVFDRVKAAIKGESQASQNLVNHIDNLETKTMTLINDARNVVSLAYTMPVGIKSDNYKFEISVDTLRYLRDSMDGSVAMDAHAYWTLPWTAAESPTTLAFKGENIVLKGSGSSRIKVDDAQVDVSTQYLPLELSKDKVYLDIDTATYVEIDCNGFKEMYLKGRVRFSSQIITWADKRMDARDSMVSASFAVYLDDLNDFFFQGQIDGQFKVKATQDVKYKALGIVADFSTKRNAENFQFPKGYKSPFAAGDEAYWTGFAIKELSFDLTEQFPEFPVDSAGAYNMLIDETGVSGWFWAGLSFGENNNKQAQNQQKQKPNSTVEAKFTEVSIGLSGGKISGGGLAGEVKIKPLVTNEKDTLTLGIDGKLYSDSNGNLNFDIKTEIKKDMTFRLPIIDTTKLTLGQGTYFQYQRITDPASADTAPKYKNVFTLVVNGGLDVNNKLVQIRDLKFEGLKLCSDAPHFDAGKFSLNSVDMPSLHGLPFGLKSMGAKTSSKNEAILQPKIYLTLIGKESKEDNKQGASAEASFDLVAQIKDDDPKPHWKLTGLRLTGIKIDLNYSAFHLLGEINGYKDDEMYGDGFQGKIEFSMKTPPINATAEARFGKTKYGDPNGNTYKYWYAYAECGMPPGIVLFPPAVYLKSVSLCAYSKIKTEFDRDLFKVTKQIPTKDIKFGFAAGIGFYAAQESMIDAKVRMGMDFSSSGGISKIFLDGRVGILGKGDDGKFNKSFMTGLVGCNYDFENSIFSLDITAKPGEGIKKYVQGDATLKLRTYPESWYCNIGTVTNPVNLTFVEKIKGRTYLMFGDSVPTVLPPLDPKISSMFEVTQSSATTTDNSEMFSNGTGFAFGVALSMDCHLNKFVYADLEFLGGLDLLVVRRTDEVCEGSGKYRAKGQVYVYLDAGAGIKFRKKKFEIVEFEAAASLMGEVPKPVYVEGNIAFRYKILGGLISGNAHANYSNGTQCSPGATSFGPTSNGDAYGVEEDNAAQDKDGNEIKDEDWEN